MSLDSPEDYARLRRHLEEIDGIFRQFLVDSGYADNTGKLGRYPHRSAIQEGKVCRKIDLQMMPDLDDERFGEYFPEIPYSLWAGAWHDEDGWRYDDGGFLVFVRLPFFRVKEILAESLAEAARRLEPVTESSLKEFGRRSQLRKMP